MKKLLLTSSLVLGLITVANTTVNAEIAADGKSADITASMSLKKDPAATDLVSITKATAMTFGGHFITPNTLYLPVTNTPELEVTDITGEAKGWVVEAKLGDFLQTGAAADVAAKLKGAQLFFPQATEFTTGNEDQTNGPTTAGGQNLQDEAEVPEEHKNGLVLSAGSDTPHPLYSAEVGKGNGRWNLTYGKGTNKKIILKVPAGNVANDYSATLTYILKDAPTP